MAIPDEMRKCVVFLGHKLDSGEKRTGGSAFWVIRIVGGIRFAYLVTARHCIEGIRDESWFHEADTPPKFLRETKSGLGDGVFVMGLFTQRVGNTKNIPIIRMGNISAMPDDEEPIRTENGPMVAYLIETHSIGGLSGSPVFIDCQINNSARTPAYCLLGLMHGHFACEDLSADSKKKKEDQLNSGITAVVPCHRITETIEYHFSESEKRSLAQDKMKDVLTPDSNPNVTVSPFAKTDFDPRKR